MICDARHPPSIGLSTRLTMANDFRAAILLSSCGGSRRRSLSGKGQSSRDSASYFLSPSSPFLPFLFYHERSSSRLNACRFRHELLSCIGEAKKRQRKTRDEFVFSSERFRSSKRDDAGRENGSLTLQFAAANR